MTVSVKSRAARILASLKGYTSYEACSDLCDVSPSDELGNIIGVYKNQNLSDGKIIVCDNGLRISNGSDSFVPFTEIDKVIYESVGEIVGVRMKDAASYDIRITGRNGKFFDATEFVRFLDRVVADQRS